MNLRASAEASLCDLKDLIAQLTGEEYQRNWLELGQATIGQHCRHIIELFQCLTDQSQRGVINYDMRERNRLIESDPEMAILSIERILNSIELDDRALVLEFDHGKGVTRITTNYSRELLYNLEHCIHHQALIRVAIRNLHHITLPDHFGVAPSTLIYRKQCVQ